MPVRLFRCPPANSIRSPENVTDPLAPEASVSAADLIALVKARKGAVQAPKRIVFVDELPITGLGKPDKKALRAQYAAQ